MFILCSTLRFIFCFQGFVSRNLPGRVSEEKLISLLVAHHLLFANDVQEYLEPNKLVIFC